MNRYPIKPWGASCSYRLYFDGAAERISALLLGGQMRTAVRRFCERARILAEATLRY